MSDSQSRTSRRCTSACWSAGWVRPRSRMASLPAAFAAGSASRSPPRCSIRPVTPRAVSAVPRQRGCRHGAGRRYRRPGDQGPAPGHRRDPPSRVDRPSPERRSRGSVSRAPGRGPCRVSGPTDRTGGRDRRPKDLEAARRLRDKRSRGSVHRHRPRRSGAAVAVARRDLGDCSQRRGHAGHRSWRARLASRRATCSPRSAAPARSLRCGRSPAGATSCASRARWARSSKSCANLADLPGGPP